MIEPREYVKKIQIKKNKHQDSMDEELLHLNDAESILNWLRVNKKKGNRSVLLKYLKSKLHDDGMNANIKEAINSISNGAEIIVISHQPTLFSYSAVYVQFILADYLANEIAKSNGEIKPVILYLCLDTDDSFDRSIKTARLPFPSTLDGSLALPIEISKHYKNTPQFKSPPFNRKTIKRWMNIINGAFGQLEQISPDNRYLIRNSKRNVLHLIKELTSDLELQKTNCFSESSSSILMQFVKLITKSCVIPLKMSELLKLGKTSFSNLLTNWKEIKDIANIELKNLNSIGVNTKKIEKIIEAPSWIICPYCSYRNVACAQDGINYLRDKKIQDNSCSKCKKTMKQGIVLPRVLLEDMLGVLLTDASIVLTYAGGASHVLLSSKVIPGYLNKVNPIYTWHPKQFLGGALDKVALSMANENALYYWPKECLGLSNSGKDSLLLVAELSSLDLLVESWHNHFSKRKLHEAMILPQSELLFKRVSALLSMR